MLEVLENVTDFLENNEVKTGWRELIVNNEDVCTELQNILGKIKPNYALPVNDNRGYVPAKENILKAFSYAEPADIKVVFIGTSPVNTSAANGLCFSCDPGANESPAMTNFRRAEKDGGVTNHDHKDWARKGVLLLNAALTITHNGQDTAVDINRHNAIWHRFLTKLLSAWLNEYHPNLFVVLLGYEDRYKNYAKTLWEDVTESRTNGANTIFEAHHPTFPRMNNNFRDKGKKIFEILSSEFIDIFILNSSDLEAITNGVSGMNTNDDSEQEPTS